MGKLRYRILAVIIAFVIAATATTFLSAPAAEAAAEHTGSTEVTVSKDTANVKKEVSTEAAIKWENTTQRSVSSVEVERNKVTKVIVLSVISVGFLCTASWIVVGKVKKVR